ncbi:hypothetical protein [Halococcus saccharolyticus]|nr:hypothetical protein [Halococcus saccharolyticus]
MVAKDRLHARETVSKAQTDIDLRNDAAAIERLADAAELLARLADEDEESETESTDGPIESAVERIGRAR